MDAKTCYTRGYRRWRMVLRRRGQSAEDYYLPESMVQDTLAKAAGWDEDQNEARSTLPLRTDFAEHYPTPEAWNAAKAERWENVEFYRRMRIHFRCFALRGI